MKEGDKAEMQIQWVELVFNNTEMKGGQGGGNGQGQGQGRCVNVCSIDETTVLGLPVLITGGGKSLRAGGRGMRLLVAVVMVIALWR
jgi:hypothetical protein